MESIASFIGWWRALARREQWALGLLLFAAFLLAYQASALLFGWSANRTVEITLTPWFWMVNDRNYPSRPSPEPWELYFGFFLPVVVAAIGRFVLPSEPSHALSEAIIFKARRLGTRLVVTWLVCMGVFFLLFAPTLLALH